MCPREARGEGSYPLNPGMSITSFEAFVALTQHRESGYLSLLRVVPETVPATEGKADEADI